MSDEAGEPPSLRLAGPERRSTMRDVARVSAVSVMTVSRVVNNSPNVDPGTRERVLEAIETLGFHPNEAASSLRRSASQTSTIGLVVDDVGNPFCSALHRGVERVCRDRGHLLISGSSDREPGEERTLVAALLRRRVDGLVIMAADPDAGYLAEEMRRGVTSVFADRRPARLDADLVTSDNVGGARQATGHLLRHGHRRVAFLGGSTAISTSHDRFEGYAAALAGAGIGVDPHLVVRDLTAAGEAQAAAAGLMASPGAPTAVFAAQNVVAMGALRTLHRLGLAGSVALVAFDDFDLADLVRPAVTVVAQDPALIGATAAELLFTRRESLAGDPHTVVVPVRLVTRGSGEIRPG